MSTKIIVNNSDTSAAVSLGCITNEQATYVGQLINSGVDMTNFFTVDSNQGLTSVGYNIPPMIMGGVTIPGTNYTGSYVICKGAQWFKSNNIDLTTALINRLRSVGISITTGTAQTTVVAPGTSFSSLVDACRTAISTGKGISVAFTNMSNALDYGYIQAQINEFLSDTNNEASIKQAIQFLNYPIPVASGVDGQNQLEQIYWGAYYLTKFPFQSSYSSADCQTILEAIKAMTAEKANIAQSIATNFYSTYTQDDYEIKSTVLTDIISNYNILDAKYNCTANASQQISQQANSQLQSQLQTSIAGASPVNNTTLYIILATVGIIALGVMYKIKHKKGKESSTESQINKPQE